MIYITVKQSPTYHQMTLEELLNPNYTPPKVLNANETNTRTYAVESVSKYFLDKIKVPLLIGRLVHFNRCTESLREKERRTLYDTFYIPKKSGGLRRIDAPKYELMSALRDLKNIFEEDFQLLYHTSAFAYIRKRSTVDAMKQHQSNNSKWFAKLDLHDFFGSTTLDFVMSMFTQIFPISEVVKTEAGRNELRKALELAFLDGRLPQGTPISPLITNVMMIPVDYRLANTFRNFEKQSFVYTRYADDFHISSQYDFDVHKVERLVVDTLRSFNAPFSINATKTRYGSSAGANWNLGLMLNKDNEITVGYKNKRRFQSMLFNYVNDKKKGIEWSPEDIMTMRGLYRYYWMVEKDVINAIIKHFNTKNNVDVLKLIDSDLNQRWGG